MFFSGYRHHQDVVFLEYCYYLVRVLVDLLLARGTSLTLALTRHLVSQATPAVKSSNCFLYRVAVVAEKIVQVPGIHEPQGEVYWRYILEAQVEVCWRYIPEASFCCVQLDPLQSQPEMALENEPPQNLPVLLWQHVYCVTAVTFDGLHLCSELVS